MPTFADISNNINGIDFNLILKKNLSENRNKFYLTNAIRERLRADGTDKDNEKIRTDNSGEGRYPFYSAYTEFLKTKKGQTITHVTLLDTGKFHRSIFARVEEKSFTLDAYFKEIYKNFIFGYRSRNEFEKAILSYTSDQMTELFIDNFKSFIIKDLKNII